MDYPDEIKLIIDKKGILNVLWQIKNLKNNPNYAVSYEYLNSLEKNNMFGVFKK